MTTYNLGDLVWFIEQDGLSIWLGFGEVSKIVAQISGTLYEVRWMDSEGDMRCESFIAESLCPDHAVESLALAAGHHESGLRRLVGELVTRVRLEHRYIYDVSHEQRQGIQQACERVGDEVYLRSDFRLDKPGVPELIAAGLLQHFPGDDMAILTPLGEHVAQQEL